MIIVVGMALAVSWSSQSSFICIILSISLLESALSDLALPHWQIIYSDSCIHFIGVCLSLSDK